MKHRIWMVALALVMAVGTFVGTNTKTASANGNNVHCVKYGETLYGIGAYYGVSAHAIAQYNGIVNVNWIRAGQCLRIPAGWSNGGNNHGQGNMGHGGYDPKPNYGNGNWGGNVGYTPKPGYDHGGYGNSSCANGGYCVKYGDTLWGIAYRHGVSVHSIAKANGIWNYNWIRAGQCLTIPSW